MKASIVEMEGLLRGKCVPAKMLVNESLAEYLVRQFDTLHERAEKAERERDELSKTLQATQGGATEAIKNVMRLQEEISRLDKESQRLSDQLGACDRQRLDWLKRALTAEAEIARRDAAAGEPYGYVHKSLYEAAGSAGLSNDHEAYRDSLTHVALYTAAPPAVLLQSDIDRIVPAIDPDGLNEAIHYIEHAIYVDRERIRSELKALGAHPAVLPPEKAADSSNGDDITAWFDEGYNQCQSDALALGAQQQKVIELPDIADCCLSPAWCSIAMQKITAVLEAANVRWEVKK